jgi:hypothetical protein
MGYADSDYDLALDWITAAEAIRAAAHAHLTRPDRILLINGSSRNEHARQFRLPFNKLAYMSQDPLPIVWSSTQSSKRCPFRRRKAPRPVQHGGGVHLVHAPLDLNRVRTGATFQDAIGHGSTGSAAAAFASSSRILSRNVNALTAHSE